MSRPPKLALPMRDGVSASALHCPAGDWPLLIDFLSERLPLVPRAEWLARLVRAEVFDETGRPLAADAAYRSGVRLYYYRQLDAEPHIPFEETVLFQDDWLVVADKPHFLPVTPKGRYVQQTLLTRLKKRLGIATLTPIHRIDRETAGLTLFSVRPESRDAYQRLFRERHVDKLYEAVAPEPAQARQDLTLPMLYRSRLQERADAFMQMQEAEGEPNAETHIELLRRLPGGLAHYALRPRSGRKHQLRAQMSALGLPIVGDRIYPLLQPAQDPPDFEHPLQLLARALAFTDPCTGQQRRFESTLQLALLAA